MDSDCIVVSLHHIPGDIVFSLIKMSLASEKILINRVITNLTM